MVRLFRRLEVKEYNKLLDVTLVYEVDVEVGLVKDYYRHYYFYNDTKECSR